MSRMAKTTPRKDTRGGDRHKGPKARAVRVEDDLWDAVKNRATTEEKTINEAVVEALEIYVDRPATESG